MIYRYIYKITCTAGSFKDRFYFGQHTTDNLDDHYIGSGHKLLSYLKKYPNDYIKEIISFHNTEEELNQAEYDIIHPWLGNEMCLNMQEGGYYGKPSYDTRKKISKSLNGRKMPEGFGEKISKILIGNTRGFKKGNKPWNYNLPKEFQPCYGKSSAMIGKVGPNKGRQWDEEFKQNVSIGVSKFFEEHPEARIHLSEEYKKFRWVTKDEEKPKRIKVDELEYYLSLGYRRGRK